MNNITIDVNLNWPLVLATQLAIQLGACAKGKNLG